MAISPDSQWLATGGSDGTERIRDAATGPVHYLAMYQVAWAGLRIRTSQLPNAAWRQLPWPQR